MLKAKPQLQQAHAWVKWAMNWPYPIGDINHINLVLGFKWSKMTKRAHSGANLHAKLENKLSTELQKSFMRCWKMISQQCYSELVAKLKDIS